MIFIAIHEWLKLVVGQVELGFFEEGYAVFEGTSAMVTITKNNRNQFPIMLSIVPMTYSQYAAGDFGDLPSEVQNIIDTDTPTAAQCA